MIALLFGLAGDTRPNSSPVQQPEVGRSKAIEWDKVQSVARATPDAADIKWERRASEPSGASSDAERPEDVTVFRGAGHQTTSAGTRVTYVFDGDTFQMGGQRIRIANIDAPETHEYRCAAELALGNRATEKLRALLSSGTITLNGEGHDQYGRDLGTVRVNGQDVGELMIAAGLAREYGSGRRSWC